jgi:hypothetical protein
MKPRTLFVMLGVVLVLAACRPEAWEQDPAVQAVKKACRRLDEEDQYTCVEHHAVESLNPDVCRLVGVWIDDTFASLSAGMCLQAVYQAADDPSICDQLYLEGVRPSCRAYYAEFITPPPGFTVFHSDQFPMEVALPPGWAAAEGPKSLAPPFTGVLALSSWGEADFWAPAITEADASTYWPLQALAQIPSGGAYVVLIADYGYASRVQEYGPEHESRELTSLWEPKDCRDAGGASWVTFLKWGRLFRLEIYCPSDVSDATAAAVDSLVASWRFDRVFVRDPGWASVRARSLLPAEAHPEWFPVVSGASGDQDSLQALWERGTARRSTRAEMQGDIVSVTFMLTRDDSDPVAEDDDCPLDRCHWWRFEARPNDEVELMEEGGAALSLLPVKGTWLLYRDPSMGFTVEYPGDWQATGPNQIVDALGRAGMAVGFTSPLQAGGPPGLNQHRFEVGVTESAGRTLTETVELNLTPLVPGVREQIQVHCCLTVGGEQAMDLLNYPPTRWGNRQIVVLHEDWEYRLNFYPLAGMTTATPAGAEAQVALDTFLRTFSFIPITAAPNLSTPTVTPVPTPSPPATGS